ncbi:MAG: hypothetical protein AMJ56_18235 [Anaerolineae bacterium SG8_19]|nr:MAG: hypothetical protein AMJ56_18235 [Anaerolineae bacterium SG8_19]
MAAGRSHWVSGWTGGGGKPISGPTGMDHYPGGALGRDYWRAAGPVCAKDCGGSGRFCDGRLYFDLAIRVVQHGAGPVAMGTLHCGGHCGDDPRRLVI